MSYAVIETGGKQYKITNGATVTVDSLGLKEGENVTFDKVLLMVTDKGVEVGAPYLANIKLTGKVVDNVKGDKVRAERFRAKSHYHRVTGFRAQMTRVVFDDILTDSKKQKETKKSTKE